MRESQGRHELKHYINYADVLQLRARLPYVTDIDENAADGCSYRVKSLYFDNYNDKVLNEKMNGVNEREKFRLRRYNDDTSFIRLEKRVKEIVFAIRRVS
ncbi:VTC domain-containing protein [Lachnospiraceae bacterium MD1]|uniref:VTC domain-containing protein n=1 Tax=Variimorphobacter saccharofermentans TaxID=2755051 RepID=A0A839K0R3_9FIRM|nr:VTC domain-containing protein [Variimorphobacter saccharofermentans]MBB2183240.1 VTC domain-containing protein [Variimorphobacter saccharofermentans]